MDFRELHYILTVAELRSISKAAKTLYIAQPSLSQYVSKVEQRLGVKLFDRRTNPLGLTLAGECYVDMARRILEINKAMHSEIEDIKNLNKGRLTIGVPFIRGSIILPQILLMLKKKFPGIQIILKEGTSLELEELTFNGKTDFTIMNSQMKNPQVIYEPILNDEILVACSTNHPLGTQEREDNIVHSKTRVSLSAFENDRFILLTPGQRLRQVADELFSKAGIEPQIEFETRSVETAHALAAAGLGIAFVTKSLAVTQIIPQKAVYFRLEDRATDWTLVIAYRKEKYITKMERKLIEVLKNSLKESIQ